MSAYLNAFIKHCYSSIKAKRYLSIIAVIGVVFSQLLPFRTFFSQAAETITTGFHAFNYTYPSVQDTTNMPPGVVLKLSTAFGYFVDVSNNSSIFSANNVTANIEMPSLSAFDITTGGMTTYTDLECSYVIATTGTSNYNIDFNGSGTPCTVNLLSGTNIQLTGGANIPIGQTSFYRVTGMSTKSSYGIMPFTMAAKGSAAVTFNGSPSSTIPLNSFIKVGEATITGNVFYDNGPNGDADNGSQQLGESLVTTSNSVVVTASAGVQAYSGPVDNMGNYSITIPENNEVGSLAYSISVPTLPSNFRLTSGLSSGVVLDQGGVFNLDIGINNQTDLALTINATLPPGTQVGTTAMVNVVLNNFGPTDATDVQISIPESGPHYSLASSSPGAGNSYTSGIWALPYLGGGSSQVFSMFINLDSAGTVDITAEVIGMTTPISTFGSPDQDSTPNNHIFEDDQMNIAFVVNNATTISGFIFEDRIENSTYNGPSEDPNFPDVTVNLYDITGTAALIDTVQTDNNGNYTFAEGIESGRSYRTEVILPDGYVTTTDNLAQEFTIFLAGDSHSASFVGLFHSGTISGQVFLDANRNNIRDSDEHAGVEGILVELINGSGSTVASNTTDQNGQYSFPNLHVSAYILQFHAFDQYLFAEPNVGPTTNDSDVIAGSGYTTILPIFSNTFLENIDAGVQPASAELSISKVADRTEAAIGNTITYTITVHNAGPLHSSGSMVTDLLPQGLSYISHSVSGGSFNPDDGKWSLPDMASSTEVQLQIAATANTAGIIRNVASLTTLAQTDTDQSNNSAYYDVNVQSSVPPSPTPTSTSSPSPSPTPAIPELHIEKLAYVNHEGTIIESSANNNGPNVSPNNELVYHIAIINTGSGIAQNISVADTMPTSLTNSGWICSYSAGDEIIDTNQQNNLDFNSECQISGTGAVTNLPVNLPSNSTLVIQFSGKTVPNVPGALCNTASVQASQVAPLSDSACLTVRAPQLMIRKSANTSQVIPGGTVNYTITVTNNGNTDANNVEIIDDLTNSSLGTNIIPSCVLSTRQVTLLDNGQFLTNNSNAASWSISTLATGSSATVRLQVEIRNDLTSATVCNNTAITSGTNLSSSQDSAVVNIPVFTPAGAIISFNKQALNDQDNHVFNPGDHVQYRLTVNNTGTQNSELLSIHDEGNSQYLLNNSVQNSGGIVTSTNPLHIKDLLVSGGRSHIINYDTSISDADHFPLNAFRLHKNADKSDRDFYPERIARSRLRNNTSNASDILKAPDGQAVTLGSRGSITVNTNRKGKLVVDGDGDDFCIATLNMQTGAKYRVSVGQSDDDANFEELGTSNGRSNCFDLNDADIAWANYIKVEDRSPNGALNSTNIDAICLLHLGGLVENTATLSANNQQIAESTSTIVVDFTDIFESPLSSNDCRSKQARIAESFPPLPLPPENAVIVQARIPETIVEAPIELPKTGSASALALVVSGGVSGMYYLGRRRKQKT